MKNEDTRYGEGDEKDISEAIPVDEIEGEHFDAGDDWNFAYDCEQGRYRWATKIHWDALLRGDGMDVDPEKTKKP